MEEIGFDRRKNESSREENAQAALIRDLVMHPEEYGGMHFIASEFDLFGFGKNGNEIKRP